MTTAPMHLVRPGVRALPEALCIAPAVLALAHARGAPVLATTIATAEATVMGALQRRTDASALRRWTTGPPATIRGEVLHHVLALAAPDALAADGRVGNLLNRNVRGFLAGYSRAGVRAHYFGREHIAFDRRPGPLLGYDVDASGGVLIEVLAGLDVATSAGGVGLREVCRKSRPAAEIAELVHRGFVSFWDRAADEIECPPLGSLSPEPDVPPEATPWWGRDVPIGRVEAAIDRDRGRAYLRGSFLSARHAVLEVERVTEEHLAEGRRIDDDVLAPLAGAPLEGARPSDLLGVLRDAASA